MKPTTTLDYHSTVKHMYTLALKHNTYPMSVYDGIINAILNYYMVTVDYSLMDCISTFEEFLSTNMLSFSRKENAQ